MFENEEPWQVIKTREIGTSEVLQIIPQVPEVTIISDSIKTPINNHNNNNNFLHRAMLTEKAFKTSPNNNPVHQNNALMGPLPLQSNQQQTFNRPLSRNPVTPNNAQQNLFNSPQVPDVTILDDVQKPLKHASPKTQTDRVFNESYKEMLINTHDHFLRQIQKDQFPSPTNANDNSNKKRSNFLNAPPPTSFKLNPLSKYAPKMTDKPIIEKDGNSSSILIDVDDCARNNSTNKTPSHITNENDEATFEKVAKMLSEIQKLVIPPSTPSPQSSAGRANEVESYKPIEVSKKCEVLRHLAKKYLSSDELTRFQVEKELRELEDCNKFL
jgi:hypothetical protein